MDAELGPSRGLFLCEETPRELGILASFYGSWRRSSSRDVFWIHDRFVWPVSGTHITLSCNKGWVEVVVWKCPHDLSVMLSPQGIRKDAGTDLGRRTKSSTGYGRSHLHLDDLDDGLAMGIVNFPDIHEGLVSLEERTLADLVKALGMDSQLECRPPNG